MAKIVLQKRIENMNISFGANLIVNKSYGKNTPSYVDKENLFKIKDEYQKFLKEDPLIGVITEEDTIELSSKKEKDGYYIYVDFQDNNGPTPYKVFHIIMKNSKQQIDLPSLKMLTLALLANKSGIDKERKALNSLAYIQKGVDVYTKQYIDKKHKKE